MNPLLRWRLYYADGSTFDNMQGTWEEAPQMGIIAAVTADETKGRLVYHKMDFYYKVGEHFGCSDLVFDLAQRFGFDLEGWDTKAELLDLMHKHPEVKFGEWVANDEYRAILNKATTDPDFSVLSPKRRFSDKHLRDARG